MINVVILLIDYFKGEFVAHKLVKVRVCWFVGFEIKIHCMAVPSGTPDILNYLRLRGIVQRVDCLNSAVHACDWFNLFQLVLTCHVTLYRTILLCFGR